MPLLARCLAWFSYHCCRRRIRGTANVITYNASTRFGRSEFDIDGQGNHIALGHESRLEGVRFIIRGNNHVIKIDDGCWIHKGSTLWFEDDNGLLEIGAGTTMQQVQISVVEHGSRVRIGPSCLFAQGIDIRTSDSHSIIDLQGNRLNPPRDVLIGEHTWVGAHVSILKGAEIAGDSVVATRSVVTRRFTERNLVIGGAPASILRRGISWRHPRLPMPACAEEAETPIT